MDDCRSNREDLPGIEGSRFQLTGSMMMPKGDVLAPSLLQPIYLAQHGQVMTDEQLEALRRQISVYATICQQLVEMHKASVAQQSHLNSISAAQSLQYDQSITGYKTTARHRWTPSQTQLHLLEKLFDQGIGTPNKQKIKEITAELSQYGTISEANVYNWFQNRKARSKRKQQPAAHREGESELDTDADSPQEKKAKSDQMQDYTSVHSDIDGQALGGQLNVDQHTLEMKGGQGHYEKSATSGDNGATITIFVNGKEWKVSAGVFNLKSSFGETAVLLNGQGQIIATNESGAILQPLSAGERYTLTELDGGRESDTFSPSTVHGHNTHQFVGSFNEAFAKRSTLHAHTQNQFHSM